MCSCYVLSIQENLSDHKIHNKEGYFLKPQFCTSVLDFHKAFFINICNLKHINKKILKLYFAYTIGSQMVKRFVTVR